MSTSASDETEEGSFETYAMTGNDEQRERERERGLGKLNIETEHKDKSIITDKGRKLQFRRFRVFIHWVGRTLYFL